MRAYFIYEKFSEQSDPIQDMGIGRPAYCQNIFVQFDKDLKERFNALMPIHLEEEENFYIDIPLDYYSDYGTNNLEKIIKKLIREKYKGKLEVIDDNFLQKYYRNEWPDESPFFIDESILVKIL